MKSKKRTRSHVVIRKMTPKDYAAVLTLWREGDLPYRPRGRDSKKNILWQLQQPTSLYFIAEENGTAVGVIFGTHDGRKGWINRLVVTPTHRKQGIARRLVEEIERQLAARGLDIVACLIEEWNTTSIQVFERLGYTKHDDIIYYSKRKTKDV